MRLVQPGFQSAPSLRRATGSWRIKHIFRLISIRALLAEGDPGLRLSGGSDCGISIRALLAEGDHARLPSGRPSLRFQSAPSLRRATRRLFLARGGERISIRALLAEGDAQGDYRRRGRGISIRALLAEGDLLGLHAVELVEIFQSAPSLRRATSVTRSRALQSTHFNPRPPCGGRPTARPPSRRPAPHFNPRPPCGGRPGACAVGAVVNVISIRALLAEGD